MRIAIDLGRLRIGYAGETTTAHELAADGEWAEQPDVLGFVLGRRGRRLWTLASYGQGVRVKIMSLSDGDQHAHCKYVHPDTVCTVVFDKPS